ncbi:MAG: lysophospholipase [Lentihominibacter sp.]|jgi:alpha-beta hydrolase superfamily lysophospholipase
MYTRFILEKTDAGEIAGYEWPLSDPDKVVCIIHGIGEYGARYNRVAERLTAANIAVVTMDLRGHGNSFGKRGHCAPRDEVLRDVSELILYARKNYPGREIVVYGHSMGGNIALDYRSRGEYNSVPAGYMISAPWIRLVRPVSSLLYYVLKGLSKVVPKMTIPNNVDEKILGHPDSVGPYARNPMIHGRISLQCVLESFETGKAMEDGTNESNGRAARIPTMIMHGTADGICDIEGSRRVYETLKARGEEVFLTEWEGYFHEIHNGGPESRGDEVIESIIEFVSSTHTAYDF